ncbi:hypothetical protein [Streptomyces sp. B1I3]|uniref:hypothetical protein n=1 Tax=Streptomyces sp. B1I3 TaxID=3042264 RepID=UPI002784E758|nr:hypothetical protein [Streptomyces sp. B1I3]MDQ0795595.1 hypothetical protein [Streptomyces sp. B1I3]
MSALEELRALLEAVVEAIDLPHPDTVGDADAYRDLLDRRAGLAVIVARAALAEEPDAYGWNAAYLRRKIAEYPIAYRAYEKPEASR